MGIGLNKFSLLGFWTYTKPFINMANVRQQFEKELKTKLNQKSTAHMSDESVLLKAFKYFDLDNSGAVSQKEWLKALERIGFNSLSNA